MTDRQLETTWRGHLMEPAFWGFVSWALESLADPSDANRKKLIAAKKRAEREM